MIALSSGEKEFYGLVKGAAHTLGIQSMAKDLGIDAKARILMDATAARGIATRRGAGRIRHIQTPYLWIQDCVASGRFSLDKVASEHNVADAGTKFLDAKTLWQHVSSMGSEERAGKSSLSLKTHA